MFEQGFPVKVRDTVSRILPFLPCRTVNGMRSIVTEHGEDYTLEGELIQVPNRVYLIEPDCLPSLLNTEEQAVIDCIYSRSWNGFVREKSVLCSTLHAFPFLRRTAESAHPLSP